MSREYPCFVWREHPFYNKVAIAEIWYTQQYKYERGKAGNGELEPLAYHNLNADLASCSWETLVAFFPPPPGYIWSRDHARQKEAIRAKPTLVS